MEKEDFMDNKLMWSVLTIIPIVNIVAAILYFLLLKPTGKEAIIVLVGIIPLLNLVCGILLTLNAIDVISLN